VADFCERSGGRICCSWFVAVSVTPRGYWLKARGASRCECGILTFRVWNSIVPRRVASHSKRGIPIDLEN
jgi:hypothetical protein